MKIGIKLNYLLLDEKKKSLILICDIFIILFYYINFNIVMEWIVKVKAN